jgi:hypothetical protein
MSTYRINFTTTASLWVKVEADDLDEAIDKAYDQKPSTDFADSPFDLGDWEPNEDEYYVDGELAE